MRHVHTNAVVLSGVLDDMTPPQPTQSGTFMLLKISTHDFQAYRCEQHQAIAWNAHAERFSKTFRTGDCLTVSGVIRTRRNAAAANAGALVEVTGAYKRQHFQFHQVAQLPCTNVHLVGIIRSVRSQEWAAGGRTARITVETRALSVEHHDVLVPGHLAEAALRCDPGDTVDVTGTLTHPVFEGWDRKLYKSSLVCADDLRLLDRGQEHRADGRPALLSRVLHRITNVDRGS